MAVETLDLDKVQKALEKLEFAEANLGLANTDSIIVKDKEVYEVNSGISFSLGFRVLISGSFGFASTNNPENWQEALRLAEKLARTNPRPLGSRLSEEKAYQDEVRIKAKKSLNTDLEEKTHALLETYKEVDIPKEVVSTELVFIGAQVHRAYLNSEGARIIQKFPRSLLACEATAKRDFTISASEKRAGLYGLEIMEGKEEMFQTAIENSVRLLASERPPSGKLPVILDQKMAGVLAHEAVGHACEADEVINGRSILAGKLGERLGSELVTIVDDAAIPRLFGSYAYDWEGVPARRNVLIEEGVLVGFLHSRETAGELEISSTGNARAENPREFPLVRMSNTFFEAGDAELEEMIEDVKFGIYVHGMKGGVTDTPSGQFQFAAEYGELIERGEITRPLRDVTISGNFLEVLKKVDMVGKDWIVGVPGFCGKSGQSVPVTDGGPPLRIKEMLMG